MYENPINMFFENTVNDIVKKVNEQQEDYVMECVRKVGVDVNKEELVRALNYDRRQYEKGYEDGMQMAKFIYRWLADNFDPPCEYYSEGSPIAEFMNEDCFCADCSEKDNYYCWEHYFEKIRR